MSTAVLDKPKAKTFNARDTLTGILPPFTMPFDRRGEIVFPAIKQQVDFAVERGVNGIVVGGSTGEGHTLGASRLRVVFCSDTREAPPVDADDAGRDGRMSILIVDYRSTIRDIRSDDRAPC